MSHLHVPDGVLPWWLVIAGWLVTAAIVGVCIRVVSADDMRRRIPLIGAVAALMLVGMSSEIVPIAYHINLTVVGGILIGPVLAWPAALVVVTILALLGHGGVTVIGLNTLVIGAEMALGAWLFRALRRALGPRRSGWSAALATVATLALTTSMLVGIVALGGAPAASRESGAFDPATLRFENPFGKWVLGSETLNAGEPTPPAEDPAMSLTRFALMVYTLGSIGWVIEAAVTGGIISFIAGVRPSLVEAGGLAEDGHRSVGDEGSHV
ncbi:MAG TPA: energy-coupling factor ABC transporter permease [Coriobacteriia bacterium]|nr:energy-coupling factor ABC transporter permease [Coriobacteriia bacterium]